jgi:hypothetical protein
VAERAVVYSVRVRPKETAAGAYPQADEFGYLPLGSIDKVHPRLIEQLAECLNGFRAESDDASTVLRQTDTQVDGDQVFVLFRHGRTNERALLTGPTEAVEFRQLPIHTHSVRCGSLFDLPPSQSTGWVAIHVHDARRYKGLLQKGIAAAFRERFPDLVLEIEPVVIPEVLRQAVRDGHVKDVELRAWTNPEDEADAIIQKWAPAGRKLHVKVSISGARGVRLLPGPLLSFFEAPSSVNRARVLEFPGYPFQEAAVTVMLPNSTTKTFNIDDQESGFPVSQDLNFEESDDEGPTPASLRAALEVALEIVR